MIDRFLPFLRELKRKGVEDSWLVGGVVRDLLLEKEPADVDVVCSETDAETLVSKVGGVTIGKPPFCTVSTFLLDCPVEIALLTGTSIQKDLERRDFTINAIAADAAGNIIDPFGGAADISQRILRLVPPLTPKIPPYEADPVRVVRLLRFACTLGFTIEPETEKATKKFILSHLAELANIPKERYGKEFLKGFAFRPYDFLTMLEDYSLLPAILPEIEAMRGVEQPPAYHPEGDVLTHTFHTLAEVQKIMENRHCRDVVLALSALFHDTGKPQTLRPHPKYGHNCFFGHDETGEKIASDTLSSWAVPGSIASEVASLVRYHMILGGEFTERTCVKLIRRLGNTEGDDMPLVDRLFDLALCDSKGAMGSGENIIAARKLFCEVRDNFFHAKDTSSKKWLDGHDVMEILDIPPGRKVGQILEELDVAIGTGKLRNKDEAVEWLKNGMPFLDNCEASKLEAS